MNMETLTETIPEKVMYSFLKSMFGIKWFLIPTNAVMFWHS